jgi:lysozyme
VLARRAAPFVLSAITAVGCASEVDRSQFIADETAERSQALSAACPPVGQKPETGPVQGIDISTYQTVSDWNAVAASENFVILKATQGTTSVDSKFASHRAGARGTNLTLGYYHYLNFSSSGAAQAKHFLDTIGKVEDNELPPMLDVEDSSTAKANTPAKNLQIVLDWLAAVQTATGRKPMIYSGGGFWGGPYFGNPTELQSYSFCWSRYSASNTCPQVPENLVPQIKFWQYRADAFPDYNIPAGKTNGINGAVDQDVFYGDMAAFKAFIAASGGAAPEYSAKYSKQSYPFAADAAVTVKVGEKVTGYIEMTNTGTATWKPGTVFLAPIPRDKASPYQADTWKSATRISTVDADVKPGEVGHFNLDISGTTPGDGSLKMGWLAEGITWFADAPKGGGPKDGVAEVKVTVLPGDPQPAGGSGGAAAGSAGAAGEAGASGATASAGGGLGGGGQAGGGFAGAKGGAAGEGGFGGGDGGKAGSRSSAFAVTPSEAEDSGCGCRIEHTHEQTGDGKTGGAAAAFLLGFGLLVRRRVRAAMA